MDTPQASPPSSPVTPQPTPPPQSAPGANNHMIMGVLAYLGVLVIVPYLMAKDVPFVKFHIKQGVVLVIVEVLLWAVSGMFWDMYFVVNIIQLATLVLSVIGIVNVVQNQEKELPVIGSFAKSINI